MVRNLLSALEDLKKKKRAGLKDSGLSIAEARYVIVDTELTGLDERKDSIISIGAIRMKGGRIVLGDTFYRLVKPSAKLTRESVVVHQITPSEVMSEPEIEGTLSDFLDFCGNDVVVGHFTSIDLSFIDREMKRFYGFPLQNPVLDTFVIYDWLRKNSEASRCLSSLMYKLYEIVQCMGISSEGGHNAMMDAFITAQLFQRLIPMLMEAGISSIGELLKIGDPEKGGDIFRVSGEISNF